MVFAQLPVSTIMAVNQKSGKSGTGIIGFQRLFNKTSKQVDAALKMEKDEKKITRTSDNQVRRFSRGGARVHVQVVHY